MSWKATGYVKELTGMSRSEKLLLMILSDYYQEEEHCAWPSISRLARETLLKERHVYKLIASLEAKGFLKVTHQQGGRTTNRYTFPGYTPVPKTGDVLQDRGALSSRSNGTVIEQEEDISSRTWDTFCSQLGVQSAVGVPSAYFKKRWEQPPVAYLPWLAAAVTEILGPQLLLPTDVPRLEIAANALRRAAPLGWGFRVMLGDLVSDSKAYGLQKIAAAGPEWVQDVLESHNTMQTSEVP